MISDRSILDQQGALFGEANAKCPHTLYQETGKSIAHSLMPGPEMFAFM